MSMDYDRKDEVFSKVVRAGKRTYFFDIKSTKGNELYITLTESKKRIIDGQESYQKHKLFLYKEDFQKFEDAFKETLQKINELNASGNYKIDNYKNSETTEDISFNDL